MKLPNLKRALFPLLLTMLLSACDSEGIDRLQDDPAPGSATVSANGITSTSPNRFVQLEKINFEATLPSIITVMFQATDRFGSAIAGLQTSDFILLEDNEPVSAAETSLAIVPQEQLPFSIRTVVMIDVSSSISPSDLEKTKAAVKGMFSNAEGQSTLMSQQEIALYSFDDTVSLLRDFTGNVGNLLETVDSIQPAVAITPTDFNGAVITGTSRIENMFDVDQISQGNVIIITDGTDTAARNTFSDALDSVNGKSVYTLGVGDEISESVLEQIGTSGTFALRNFDQLNSVLNSINQAVGAESSIHNIRLSVANNANDSGTSIITDSFDSTDFSNVEAEVIISGPISSFVWSLPEDNVSCQIDLLSSTSIRVTAVAAGNCTLTAEDQTAGGVQGWFSIDVVTD